MNENSVRSRTTNPGFGQMVSRCVERRIAVAVNAMGARGSLNGERHIGTLRLLADHLAGLDMEDSRLVALWQARVAFGFPTDEGTYNVEPGTELSRVLSLVGLDKAPPEMSRIMAELVAAAFEDTVTAAKSKITTANSERQEAVTEAERLAPFESRAMTTENDLIDARAELRITKEELKKAQRETAYLRDQVVPGEVKEPKSGQKAVEGEAYIYETAAGRFKAQPPGAPAKTFETLPEAVTYRDEVMAVPA